MTDTKKVLDDSYRIGRRCIMCWMTALPGKKFCTNGAEPFTGGCNYRLGIQQRWANHDAYNSPYWYLLY